MLRFAAISRLRFVPVFTHDKGCTGLDSRKYFCSDQTCNVFMQVVKNRGREMLTQSESRRIKTGETSIGTSE